MSAPTPSHPDIDEIEAILKQQWLKQPPKLIQPDGHKVNDYRGFFDEAKAAIQSLLLQAQIDLMNTACGNLSDCGECQACYTNIRRFEKKYEELRAAQQTLLEGEAK